MQSMLHIQECTKYKDEEFYKTIILHKYQQSKTLHAL